MSLKLRAGAVLIGALTGVALLTPAVAHADSPTAAVTTATGTYTTANDTPVYADVPQGTVTFSQAAGGTITYSISVTGLDANTQYFPVPYKDGGCAPLPGVSAFPASVFTSDATGSAQTTGTVNPQALNPAGQFTLDQTRSISLRKVLGRINVPTPLPIGQPTYNLPNPVTSSCDGAPVVTSS